MNKNNQYILYYETLSTILQNNNIKSTIPVQASNVLNDTTTTLHVKPNYIPQISHETSTPINHVTRKTFNDWTQIKTPFNVILFDSCFQFSVSYINTLSIALSYLSSDGQILIINTPLFLKKIDGVKLINQMQALVNTKQNETDTFADFENFLTPKWLNQLAHLFELTWAAHPQLNRSNLFKKDNPLSHLITITRANQT